MYAKKQNPVNEGNPAQNQIARNGPRPLLLHLATAALTALSFRQSVKWLSAENFPWHPQLKEKAEKIRKTIASANIGEEELFASADTAAASWLQQIHGGLSVYQNHPYVRDVAEGDVVWREGSARLLRFGNPDAKQAIFFIPSLVNRYYILDLNQDRSLLRFLSHNNFTVYLLDWGEPLPDEFSFDFSAYAKRAQNAYDYLCLRTQSPPHLSGYCMGGMFALHVAQHAKATPLSLMLLASPWDFHTTSFPSPAQIKLGLKNVQPLIEELGYMPVDMLQSFFASIDPWLSLRKMLQLTVNAPDDFIALEDWANDGVILAGALAIETLQDWFIDNKPARFQWTVRGKKLDPRKISVPTLVVAPQKDRITPPLSAKAILPHLRKATLLEPDLGHVGAIVGRGAKTLVWPQLLDWLKSQS